MIIFRGNAKNKAYSSILPGISVAVLNIRYKFECIFNYRVIDKPLELLVYYVVEWITVKYNRYHLIL